MRRLPVPWAALPLRKTVVLPVTVLVQQLMNISLRVDVIHVLITIRGGVTIHRTPHRSHTSRLRRRRQYGVDPLLALIPIEKLVNISHDVNIVDVLTVGGRAVAV